MAYHVELKPFSRAILHYLSTEGETVVELGQRIGVKANKINAVITKSLVRYNFAQRYSELSKILKKERVLVVKTATGVRWEQENPLTDEEAQEILAEHKAVFIIPNKDDDNYLVDLEQMFNKFAYPSIDNVDKYNFIGNFGDLEGGKFSPYKFSDVIKVNTEGDIWHYCFLNLYGKYLQINNTKQ